MGRCFLFSKLVKPCTKDDPDVMRTRSGLSIRRVSSNSSIIPQLPKFSHSSWSIVGSRKKVCNKEHHRPITDNIPIVTRWQLLAQGIELEDIEINYTNQPDLFKVKHEDICSGRACQMKQCHPSPSLPRRERLASCNVSALVDPNMPTYLDPPVEPPLVIDLSISPTSSTNSTPSRDYISTSMVQVIPKLNKASKPKTSQHLLELIESQGAIEVDNYSVPDLRQKLEPFIHHLPDNRMPDSLYKCSICKRVYGDIKAFGTHINSHLKLKNKCHICGRVFTRNWLLKGHLRVHTGEKPFKCEVCGKAFADKSNLRSHVLIHTVTTKTHSCPKCNKSFAQRRYLHKHLLEVCK